MRTLIASICIVLLAGCATTFRAPETKVVTVKQPIPYCPAPPVVQQCTNYVDLLVLEDEKDPGKVAQAYKLDMACYRANDATFRDILKTYNSASLLQADVEKMFNQLQQKDTPPSSPTTP